MINVVFFQSSVGKDFFLSNKVNQTSLMALCCFFAFELEVKNHWMY